MQIDQKGNALGMAVTVTKQAEAYLEALAKALEIPPARYDQAERSYKSLGEWLHRDESNVKTAMNA